jgi:hypothetical protein
MGQGTWLADNWVAVVAAIIAGLGILASIVASRRSSAAQARQLEIEEKRDEGQLLERHQAKLRLSTIRSLGEKQWVDESSSKTINAKCYEVPVHNDGHASASDVQVRFDKKLDHPAIRKVAATSEVDPSGTILFEVAAYPNLPSSIEITWSDASGTPGRFRTTLNYGTG